MAKLHVCPCLSLELYQGNQWSLFFSFCCSLKYWREVKQLSHKCRVITEGDTESFQLLYPLPSPTQPEWLAFFELYAFLRQFWIPTLLLVRLLTQACLNRRCLIFTCWVFRSRNRTNEKFYVPIRWVKSACVIRNGLGLFSKWRSSTLSDS